MRVHVLYDPGGRLISTAIEDVGEADAIPPVSVIAVAGGAQLAGTVDVGDDFSYGMDELMIEASVERGDQGDRLRVGDRSWPMQSVADRSDSGTGPLGDSRESRVDEVDTGALESRETRPGHPADCAALPAKACEAISNALDPLRDWEADADRIRELEPSGPVELVNADQLGYAGQLFADTQPGEGQPEKPADGPAPGEGVGEPRAPAKCNCKLDVIVIQDPADSEYKATPVKDANDKPIDSEAKSIHGANVEGSALTPPVENKNKSRESVATGTATVVLAHIDPCPECDRAAKLHMWAKTGLRVEANAYPKTGREALASAEGATVARGHLKYDATAAVSVKEKQDSGLEIEIDVPLPNGGKVTQKYKPKLEEHGFKRDDDKGESRRTVTGNKMEVMLASKVRATARSQDNASASAVAVSHSLVAWYGVCSCPRHAEPRTKLGAIADDQNEGVRLATQLRDLARTGDVTPPEDPPKPGLPGPPAPTPPAPAPPAPQPSAPGTAGAQPGALERHPHQGRLQVQGDDLKQEISWKWDRDTPPTKDEALRALDALKGQLERRQLARREEAFAKARRYIQNAPRNGIDAVDRKSFQNYPVPNDYPNARVDSEVHVGRAYTG